MNRKPDTNEAATEVRIKIDPDVDFASREVGGRTSVIAHDQKTGKYYRFGSEEYRVAILLDGTRGAAQIYRQLQSEGIQWSVDDLSKFIAQLVQQQLAFVDESPQVSDKPVDAIDDAPSPPPTNWRQSVPKYLSLMISQRIPLFDGDAVAKKFESKVGPFFSNAGMLCWCLLVASGLAVVYGHWPDFADELARLFDSGLWLVLIVLWCLAKIVHEIGHAVAARRHGVKVGSMGIMFFLLAPLAYVNVTDAWKLKSRWQRVQIALAGVYLELAVASIAAWAWWILPPGLMRHLAAQIFVVAGPATLLVNANPLLRLDGYYVISDLAEIPNLRMHGRRQLAVWLEWWLFSIARPRALLSGWRRPFATVHAVCSVVFQVVWMGGLIIAVSMWARGLGIVLGIAAFLLWGLLPLVQWMVKIWKLDPPDGKSKWARLQLNPKRRRLITYACVVAMLFHYLCTAASPLSRRIPVVVRYQDEQIARASADAFVLAVYVQRGQRVSKGKLLMELDEPELRVRRDQTADDLELAQRRAIQFRRQGEIAKSASEVEKAESLSRQVAELDDQLAGLRVVAGRPGLITSPYIDRLQGSFVHRGDELLRVSDPHEKELLATVSERDMQAYQSAAKRDRPVEVRLRGGTPLRAAPVPLRPRAQQRVPHPALAATAGGPLAVEPSPDDTENVRVIEPRLEGLIPLDATTSALVRAGQIGTMTISDNRSLVARVFDAMTP